MRNIHGQYQPAYIGNTASTVRSVPVLRLLLRTTSSSIKNAKRAVKGREALRAYKVPYPLLHRSQGPSRASWGVFRRTPRKRICAIRVFLQAPESNYIKVFTKLYMIVDKSY
jgi:hypothetical protein